MTRSRGVHIYQNQDGEESWTSRVVQWLRLCSFKSGGKGLVSAQGTKIPHSMQFDQKVKLKKGEESSEKKGYNVQKYRQKSLSVARVTILVMRANQGNEKDGRQV